MHTTHRERLNVSREDGRPLRHCSLSCAAPQTAARNTTPPQQREVHSVSSSPTSSEPDTIRTLFVNTGTAAKRAALNTNTPSTEKGISYRERDRSPQCNPSPVALHSTPLHGKLPLPRQVAAYWASVSEPHTCDFNATFPLYVVYISIYMRPSLYF